ncbi:MAG: alanine racemase [Nannocystaceae bacterium]
MYLQHVIDRDPQLLATAIDLHQRGRIPPNTWVVDLDTVVDNARALASEANRLGLQTYLMAKQHNRNPYISGLGLAAGLGKLVAVDATGALMARRYALPLGNVGHLNQIPRHLLPAVTRMRPEVFTVYNIEHARWVNHAAADLDTVQDLLIRVSCDDDVFFEGQEGGFREAEVPRVVGLLRELKHVRLVGVTSFPCLRYNEREGEPVTVTENMKTITRVAAQLTDLGVQVEQINAPGNTSCAVMALLKRHGATHVEPGNALLGTVPSNAFRSDVVERTAFVYVSEVSHWFDGRAYAYGGGVFHSAYSDRIEALVGSSWGQARDNRVEYLHHVKQCIDYHMQLQPTTGQRCEVGDSVVLAYRTQMQMTRSYVAPVSGISGRRPLKLHRLFDHANTALDESFSPVGPDVVRRELAASIEAFGLSPGTLRRS